MKKVLLTAVLVVAVLTSLTAGTLANYTQTQTIDGNVKPLYFAFTRTGVQGFNTTVKLAPGMSQVYAVEVKNNSEMTVNFDPDKAFSSSNAFTDCLVTAWCSDANGTLSTTTPNLSLATGATGTFYLKVAWDDGKTNSDNEVAISHDSGSLATLHVSITGTSV